jgi:hypothetical protein
MTPPAPDEIAHVREEGCRRRRRAVTPADRRRIELAPVVNTGMLTDEDVSTLHAAYIACDESSGKE